jgi:hypothetical protein
VRLNRRLAWPLLVWAQKRGAPTVQSRSVASEFKSAGGYHPTKECRGGQVASNDYTRICDRCGASWHLPEEWATEGAPSKDLIIKASYAAGRATTKKQQEQLSTKAVVLQEQMDRVASNAQCPSCGYSGYIQYKPGAEPADS